MIKIGKVTPVNGVYISAILLILFIFFISVLLIFLFGHYSKTEHATGIVIRNGFTSVVSPTSGVIQKIRLHIGDEIQKSTPFIDINIEGGDILVRNNDNNKLLTHEYTELLAEIDKKRNFEKKSFLKKLDLLVEENKLYSEKINSLINMKISAKNNLDIMDKKIKKMKSLLINNYISTLEFNQATADYNNISISIDEYSSRLAAIKLEQSTRQLQIIELRERENNAILEYKRQKQSINEKINSLYQNKMITIPSPRRGYIDSIAVTEGDKVKMGDVIATIKSYENQQSNDMFFILKVKSSAAGSIKKGQKVNIRVDAFPYAQNGVIPATISMISNSVLGDLTFESLSEDKYYQVTAMVAPDYQGKIPLNELKNGMIIETDIKTEELSLTQWLFLPLKKGINRNVDFYEKN